MTLDLLKERGTPLSNQRFTLRELNPIPHSKLDDDAFTRVRIILMNGIESEAIRFKHLFARLSRDLRLPLAETRRVEHHQQTMVNWLLPGDLSPLETTIAYEQVAIEVTASLAQHEPDPYLAQVLRFGLLEDFDHLYRYSALLDRLEGKDANAITQCYTDILPGRPTAIEHRHPVDDLRHHYDRKNAAPISRLNTLTIVSAEYQTHDYYMHVGPLLSDPVGRMLYAEIASIEEQHVTQYESLIDPEESWLEQWLLHEATEVYNYYSCAQQESNPRIRALWERFVDYELGHLHAARELFEKIERRDAAEVLPSTLPDPIDFSSHREFVRKVLNQEVDFAAQGTEIKPRSQVQAPQTDAYRDHFLSEGSASEAVADRFEWTPGTELTRRRLHKELDTRRYAS
ncbi:MAG TPA: hypothetical protein VKY73_06700 [Polyangiaceae bacterium]|nr:hypothetical protein [Polyangiaceae bacterium]